ncbi:MAG: hypothetical protein FWG21_01340 [Oscillospiraceae bacterium]|nr:hypothetical protein [Oscillospiraceae bacterium]
MNVKITLRAEEDLYEDIKRIAEDRGAPINQIMNEALKMYRDSTYLDKKSSVIPSEIKQAIRAEMELVSNRDMNKVRQILSAMAINEHVLQRVIAEELEVSHALLLQYRQEVVELLRESNRVFDLREIIE